MKFIAIMSVLLCLISTPALAAKQQDILGFHGHWTAYQHSDKNKPVCYIAAPPVSSKSSIKKRDPAFILITHRPSDNTLNVISHVAGYKYDEKKPVIAQIDKRKYLMIAAKDTAWTPNQDTDNKLAAALKKGSKLVVTGITKNGDKTVDTYDLKGVTKAMSLIDKACKVK